MFTDDAGVGTRVVKGRGDRNAVLELPAASEMKATRAALVLRATMAIFVSCLIGLLLGHARRHREPRVYTVFDASRYSLILTY